MEVTISRMIAYVASRTVIICRIHLFSFRIISASRLEGELNAKRESRARKVIFCALLISRVSSLASAPLKKSKLRYSDSTETKMRKIKRKK